MTHQYFDVDLDEAWTAAMQDLPEYARLLRARALKKPSMQLEDEIDAVLKHAKKVKRRHD